MITNGKRDELITLLKLGIVLYPFVMAISKLFMGILTGKKLLLLGERDGVPSPAMESVFKNSGAEVVFSATECFV